VASFIPTVIISFIFYSMYSNTLKQWTVDVVSQNVDFLCDFMENYFKRVESAFFEIYNANYNRGYTIPQISTIIEKGMSSSANEYFAQRDTLNSYYYFIREQNRDIVKVSLFSPENILVDEWNREIKYSAIKINKEDDLYISIFSNQKNDPVFFSYYDNNIKQNMIVMGRNIYDIFTKKRTGTAVYHINIANMEQIMNKYSGMNSIAFIINKQGQILFHTDAEKIGQKCEEKWINLFDAGTDENTVTKNINEESIVSCSSLLSGNLKLFNIFYMHELQKNKVRSFVVTLLVMIAMLVLVTFLSLTLSRSVSNPIVSLCKTMRKVEDNNFDISITPVKREDEIGLLYNSFSYMIHKIKSTIREKYEMELRNKEIELIVLQSQINPHFLYNTLQIIGGKAILNGDYEINSMCRALSDIFRYSISDIKNESTIDDEVRHVNNYMFIQKIRYGDALNFYVDVDENVKQCDIIRLILQPVIENCIIHGIDKHCLENQNIWVKIRKKLNVILIEIKDDGPGIHPDKLEEIKGLLDFKPFQHYSGLGKKNIGIRNVNSRIKLYYGEKYGLKINSKEGIGTKVTIIIPYRKRM